MWGVRRKNDSEVSDLENWLQGGVINQKTNYRQRNRCRRQREWVLCFWEPLSSMLPWILNMWGLFSFCRSEFKCYLFRESLNLLTSDFLSAPTPPLHSALWCWAGPCELHLFCQSTSLLDSTIGCIRLQGALQAEGGKNGLVFLPVYFCCCHCCPGNSNWF